MTNVTIVGRASARQYCFEALTKTEKIAEAFN